MFVGVGARRVRDLFSAAKKRSPCITFMDEIDAIGGSRIPKDQQHLKMTWNQILELDEFKQNEGVIVLPATNSPESSDKALVCPGCFNRHLVVPNPDGEQRLQILGAHISKVPKAENVDLPIIVRGMPGFFGEDLANLMNLILSGSEKDSGNSCRKVGATVHGGKEAGGKTWIQSVIPARLWPFAQLARLDKPIGTWLLAWPCFWSICLAAPSGKFPDLEILGWFGVGAILLRGSGCTVNDLLDSDIDGKVERTRQRPIASGALTPFQGLSFLGCQLLLGLGVLLQLNDFSRILGASSLLLVGTYPLTKRWTFWPQAYLGLTFNWGALLGWAAVHGDLNLSVVLPLYASGVCWTLVYDTIYAHQDKEDDMKVGVKSTALWFGDKTQLWLTGFSAGCIGGLTLAGWNCSLGWPFYAGMAAAAGHLAWQVSSVNIHNRDNCNSIFVSNRWFGAIVCSAIVIGKLVALPT